MIDLALSPEDEQKRNQTMQTQRAPLATPQAPQQQKGMGGQMMDMAKQRAMTSALDAGQGAITSGISSALAPTVASGVEGGAMLGAGGAGAGAAMATAIPYVGAGLLAGKALGLFNEGGRVGPLSAQYAADGDKARSSYQYQMKMGRQNKKDTDDIIDMIRKNIEFSTSTAPRNAQAVGLGDPIAERKYGAGSYGTYYDQGGEVMSEEQAMALMNNQPEPTPMPMMRPNPDELYNEIMAESMTEAAQQAMPMMRAPLGADPLNADTTYSPYDMIRPDNAPNT